MSETTGGTAVAAPPTRASSKALRECKTLQEAFGSGEFLERIKAAVPKHLSADRMLRTFVQATSKQPTLLQCDMRGIIGQFLTCSILGLEVNTPLGHAYIIPFKRRVKRNNAWEEVFDANLVIGYKGYVDLAFRSGKVAVVDADVVLAGDNFRWEKGIHHGMRYIQQISKSSPDAKPTHAYSMVHLTNGGKPFEVMFWEDVLSIRNSSQGYQAAVRMKEEAEKKGWALPRGYTEAPWVKHVIPMGAKTPFRSLASWIQLSPEMAGMAALDAAADNGRVHYGHIIDETGNILDAAMDGIDDDVDSADAAFGMRDTGGDGGGGQADQKTAPAGTTTVTVGGGASTTTQQTKPPAEDPEKDKLALFNQQWGDAAGKMSGRLRNILLANAVLSPDFARKMGRKAFSELPNVGSVSTQELEGIIGGWSAETAPAGQGAQQGRASSPPTDEPPPPTSEDAYGSENRSSGDVAQQQPSTAGETTVQEFWLVDEIGEPLPDDRGYTQDAAVFAERFIELWRPSRNREALIEHNADAIADARAASRDATTIIAEIERTEPEQEKKTEPAPVGNLWLIKVPTNDRGTPNLPGYVQAVRTMMASITKPSQMTEWLVANEPVYAKFPQATRTAIHAAVQARRSEIAPAAQEQVATSVEQAGQASDQARDMDMERAQQMIEAINSKTTVAELNAYSASVLPMTLLNRFDRERPELSQTIRDAAVAKRTALQAAG